MAASAPAARHHEIKAAKRRLEIEAAEFRLRREIDRQDAAHYRDWTKLVEAVLEGIVWSAM